MNAINSLVQNLGKQELIIMDGVQLLPIIAREAGNAWEKQGEESILHVPSIKFPHSFLERWCPRTLFERVGFRTRFIFQNTLAHQHELAINFINTRLIRGLGGNIMEAKQQQWVPAGTVKFACPQCGGVQVTRTPHERTTVIKYTCSQCGFVGPN